MLFGCVRLCSIGFGQRVSQLVIGVVVRSFVGGCFAAGEGGGGEAQFAAQGGEFAALGLLLLEVFGGGAAVDGDVSLEVGELGGEGVAGGVLEDGLPVLFEGAEVAVDGGGCGVELLGDGADGCAALAELVCAEDASALSGREGGRAG